MIMEWLTSEIVFTGLLVAVLSLIVSGVYDFHVKRKYIYFKVENFEALYMLRSELDSTSDSIVKEASETLDALTKQYSAEKKSFEQIKSSIDIISAIAEQTNMLAMNAAIEAARAGEEGRGFAVVADQVRSLAMSTSDSAATISSGIASINEQSDKVFGLLNELNEKLHRQA